MPKGASDRSILIAVPKSLGDLRQVLPDRLGPLVHAELAKDFTKAPNADMPKHPKDVLAV